jgi:hypothetical protein
MTPEAAHRFENEFAPRIANWIAQHLDAPIRVDVVPREGPGHPTRVRITGEPDEHRHLHAYPYPLNVSLTWDSAEIERLMDADGEARFEHYLRATSRKLHAWESARALDFETRTQDEPEILIGGLDFEGVNDE